MSTPPDLPPVPSQFVRSPRNEASLAALTELARADLDRLRIPGAAWSAPRTAPDGSEALDVLIVGGGMCGQTVAFALLREGVTRIRVIDRAAPGDEGPWDTYARMLTLRSPKALTGPDLGVASLTFRAWYEAQHGEAGWNALHKVGRLDWRDYLLWLRRTVGIEVQGETELLGVEPRLESGLIEVRVKSGAAEHTWWCRRLVLALGREGSGAPRWPALPSLDPRSDSARGRVFHSTDRIDFEAMRGRQIAVLGAGASGFENAATALEAGATVSLFARRALLPQVNNIRWTGFAGYMRAFASLDDARKWRFHTYIAGEQVPPPWESVRRCDRHEAFTLRLGEPWLDARAADGGVTVRLAQREERFDAVVVCTGFDVDLTCRPELGKLAPFVDTWGRHVSPAQAEAHPGAARFPYLGPGFELRATDPAFSAAFDRIHLFNWGSTLSHGAIAAEIPGLAIGANRLADAIVRSLFVEDADAHWERLVAYDDSELAATRWYVPPDQR